MNILRDLLVRIVLKRKGYRIELPVGLELSDGDRAAIYGWPDRYVEEAVDGE